MYILGQWNRATLEQRALEVTTYFTNAAVTLYSTNSSWEAYKESGGKEVPPTFVTLRSQQPANEPYLSQMRHAKHQ